MKTKILLSVFLAAVVLLTNFQTAFATLGWWTNICSGAYVQGSSLACGGKKVSAPNSSTWLAEIASYTDPGILIPVGWTYWTSRERCNGNITQQVVHGGRSVVATSTYTYQYMTKLACSGTRAGQVLGKHEVKGSNFTWYYDWTQSDTVP